MELISKFFKKSISILIIIIFTFSNIYVQDSYALSTGRNNISPQSVFLPFDGENGGLHMKDLAMLQYVMHTAVLSGNVDLLQEGNDRTAVSLGVDLGEREDVRMNFHFRQAQDLESSGTSFRLIPCSMNNSGRREKYWCTVFTSPGNEGPRYVFLRDDEKSREDLVDRLIRLKYEERKEQNAINMAFQSEKEQDEKIRRALEGEDKKRRVINYDNFALPLSFISGFLGAISDELETDFDALVKGGQLMIITEDDPEFRLKEAHAGGQGIYLPNDPAYINAGVIVHEIFAKAGFSDEENEVFRSMFDSFVMAYLNDKLDLPGELPKEMDLFGEEMKLILEARAARFWEREDEEEKAERMEILSEKTEMPSGGEDLIDAAKGLGRGFVEDISSITATRDYRMTRDRQWRGVLPRGFSPQQQLTYPEVLSNDPFKETADSIIELARASRDISLRSLGRVAKHPDLMKNIWSERVSQRDVENIERILRVSDIQIKVADDQEKHLTGGGIAWFADKRQLLVYPELNLIEFYVLLSDSVEYLVGGENIGRWDREITDELMRVSRSIRSALEESNEYSRVGDFLTHSADMMEAGALSLGLRGLIAEVQMREGGEQWLKDSNLGRYSEYSASGGKWEALRELASSRSYELIASTDKKKKEHSRKKLRKEILGATSYTYIGRGSKQMCFSVDQKGMSDKVIKVFLREHGDYHRLVDVEHELEGVNLAVEYLGGLIASLDYFRDMELDKMKFASHMLLTHLQDNRSFNYDKIEFPVVTVETRVLPLIYSDMYDKDQYEKPKVDTYVKHLSSEIEGELDLGNGYISADSSPAFSKFKKVVDEYCRTFEESARRGVLHLDHKLSNCGLTDSGNVVVLDTDGMRVNKDDPEDLDGLLEKIYEQDGPERLNMLFDEIRRNSIFFFMELYGPVSRHLERFGDPKMKMTIAREQLFDRMEDYLNKKYKEIFNYRHVKEIWATALERRRRSLSPGTGENNVETALTNLLADNPVEGDVVRETNRYFRQMLLSKISSRIEKILSGAQHRRNEKWRKERAMARRELRDREKQLSKMREESPVAFHMVDNSGTITYVNKKWCEIMGYTKEEVLREAEDGKKIFDYIVPEQRGNAVDRFMGRLYGVEQIALTPMKGPRQYVTRDGRRIYVETDNTILRDGKGNILGIDTSFSDVTSRVEAEKAHEEAEELLESIILNLPSVVFYKVYDEEKKVFRYKYVNEKMYEFLGLPSDASDITGLDDYEVKERFGMEKYKAEKYQEDDMRVFNGGESVYSQELNVYGGANTYVKVQKTRVGNGVLVSFTDVTGVKEEADKAIARLKFLHDISSKLNMTTDLDDMAETIKEGFADLQGVNIGWVSDDNFLEVIGAASDDISHMPYIKKAKFDVSEGSRAREIFDELDGPRITSAKEILEASSGTVMAGLAGQMTGDRFGEWLLLPLGQDGGERAGALLMVKRPGSIFSDDEKALAQNLADNLAENMIGRVKEERLELSELKRADAEERMERAFEEAPYGLVITSRHGFIHSVNRKMCEMLGEEKQDVLGKHIFSWRNKASRILQQTKFVKMWLSMSSGIDMKPFQITIARDGQEFILEFEKIRLSDGYYQLIVKDVTELERSREEFRELFMNMNEACAFHELVYDDKGNPVSYRYLEVNNSFEEMTGLKREDVLGKDVREVLPGIENDPNRIIQKFIKVAMTRKPDKYEWYVAHPHLQKWYSVSATSFRKGTFVAMFDDITKKKNNEQALLESEEKFSKVFRYHSDLMVLVTSEGEIVEANESFLEFTGYAIDDVFGKTAEDLDLFEDHQGKDAFMRDLLAQGSVKGRDIKVKRKDGQIRHGLFSGEVLSLGGSTYLQISMKDITDRVRSQEFQSILADLNAMMLREGNEGNDFNIDIAFSRMGELIQADRIYIVRSEDADMRDVTATNEWTADGVSEVSSGLKNVDFVEEFPWLSSRILKGESLSVGSLKDVPPEGGAIKKWMEKNGTSSGIFMPLIGGGRKFGFIVASSGDVERDWSREEEIYLKLMGESIANALIRKRAEADLRNREETFRELFYRLPIPVIIHNDDGKILRLNESARSLFNWRSDEIKGKSLDVIDTGNFADDRDKRFEEQRSTGTWSGEGVYKTREGRIFKAAVFTQRIGKDTVAVIQDTTERDFHVTVEALSRIVHDWRNAVSPMEHTLINLVNDMLESFPEGKSSLSWHELWGLAASFVNGKNLVNTAMNTVKGTDVLSKRHVEIGEFATQVVEVHGYTMAENEEVAKGREDNYVVVECSEEDRVYLDGKSLNMVMENLLRNAKDAMQGRKGISVIFRKKVLVQSDFDGKYSLPITRRKGGRNFKPGDEVVEIVVSDKGPGMSGTVQEHLGEFGYSTKLGKGGSGFGVNHVLERVKRMGGDLEVITEEGVGSQFILRFEASPESATNDIMLPPAADRKELKVLVADDNATARNNIVRYLKEGFKIGRKQITAPRSYKELKEALESDEGFDIAVFDQNLDLSNEFKSGSEEEPPLGSTLVGEYRNRPVFRDNTTFLMCSSTARPKDREAIDAMGLPFVPKDDGMIAFAIQLSDAFFTKNPGMKGLAEMVDLEDEAKDPLREFLRHISPDEYKEKEGGIKIPADFPYSIEQLIDPVTGLTPVFYEKLSVRKHWLSNIVMPIGCYLKMEEDKGEAGIYPEIDPGGTRMGDSDLINVVLNRYANIVPYDQHGEIRDTAEEMTAAERVILLANELMLFVSAMNRTMDFTKDLAKDHPAEFGFLDEYTIPCFDVVGRSNGTDGLAFAEALDIVLPMVYRDTPVLDPLKGMTDKEIDGLQLVKSGKASALRVKAILKYLEAKSLGRDIEIDAPGVESYGTGSDESFPAKSHKTTKGAMVRILVADDEDIIKHVMELTLESIGEEEGWNVEIDLADTAEEAQALIEEKGLERYNAILTDNNFSSKGGTIKGVEFAKWLVEEKGWDQDKKPLIMMTGNERLDEADKWVSDQLSKPFNKEKIRNNVVEAVKETLPVSDAGTEGTEEAGAAANLERSLEGFRQTFNEADIAIVCLDGRGLPVYGNKLFAELMGLEGTPSMRDLKDMDIAGLIPSEHGVRRSKIGEVEVDSVRIGLGDYSMVQISRVFRENKPDKKDTAPANSSEQKARKKEAHADDLPRILYVSGEERSRNDMLLLLRSRYNVTTAVNAQEGFDIVQASVMRGQKFDLVISDAEMPPAEGSDLEGGPSLVITLHNAGYKVPILLAADEGDYADKRLIKLFMDKKVRGVVKKKDADTLKKKIAELVKTKDERNTDIQLKSADKVALVYGNFSEGMRKLKAAGFTGTMLHASNKEDLRKKYAVLQAIRQGKIDIFINTTKEDLGSIIEELLKEILGILESPETRPRIVTTEDMQKDPELLGKKLMEVCA